MKRLIAVFSFALLSVAAYAQPKMSLKSETVDYGTIVKGSDRVRSISFTNTGNQPLEIKSARGSCGCTVPTVPKEPVMPGETKKIEINYDTNRVGDIMKTVTIVTNEGASGADFSRTITVKGKVSEEPVAVPVKKSNLMTPTGTF